MAGGGRRGPGPGSGHRAARPDPEIQGVPRGGTGHPWAGGCGVGSRSSAPALAAPTDSWPRYQFLPGDFLVTLWSSVGRRGRKTPVSWSTRSPGAVQGNSTGPCTALQTALSPCGAARGAGAGGTGPARAHAEGRRGRLGPPPLLMGKEEEVVVSSRGLGGCWWERICLPRDPGSTQEVCPAHGVAVAPSTPRALVRTGDTENPEQLPPAPAGCPSHEAVCHHRRHQKGKEEEAAAPPHALTHGHPLPQAGATRRPLPGPGGAVTGTGQQGPGPACRRRQTRS